MSLLHRFIHPLLSAFKRMAYPNMQPLFQSVDELNSHSELFVDPERSNSENKGPFLIVRDDFYPDPDAIRELALSLEYFQYKPPLAEQVGAEIAAEYESKKPVWLSSSLLRYLGKKVAAPKEGYRHSTPEVQQLLAAVIGERIKSDTWDEMGDWWNGAFHLQFDAEGNEHRVIHHHYRQGDIEPIGWSGLVYLAPDAPPGFGTTIWREKKSGRCIASKGNKYDQDMDNYELALVIENHFNRLVLFRENVLHRAGYGYGNNPREARLMQTFFFQVERDGSDANH